jgi:hypothetical protein
LRSIGLVCAKCGMCQAMLRVASGGTKIKTRLTQDIGVMCWKIKN